MGIAFMLVGFGFLIVFGATVFLAIREVWRSVTAGGAPKHAACPACGYDVRGLRSDSCPECGRSIALIGVNTQALAVKHRSSMFGLVFSWVYLHLLVGLVLAQIGSTMFLARSFGGAASTYAATLTPSSGAAQSIQIDHSLSGFNSSFGQTTVVLTDNAGLQSTLSISEVAGAPSNVFITGPDGGFQTSLGATPGPDLFVAAGLDLDDAAISNAADELDVLLTWISSTPPEYWEDGSEPQLGGYAVSMRSVSVTTQAARNPAQRVLAIVLVSLAGAVVLSLFVGGFLLARRRQRLLAPLRDVPQLAGDTSDDALASAEASARSQDT